MFRKKELILVTIMTFILLFSNVLPAYASSSSSIIKVEGEGSVIIKPDTCFINFSSISEDKEQAKAAELNAKKMEKLMKDLKKSGIKDEDLKTVSLYISPIYSYENGKQEFKTYRAINVIRVKLRDLSKIGKIIDQGIKSGADEVGSLDYTSSKLDEAYNEAFALAAKDAEMKAKSIGQAFGLEIKGPVRIEETSRNYNKISAGSMDLAEEKETSMGGPVHTPINIDDLEISASLSVDYGY